MAYLTSTQISQLAVQLLGRRLVLPMTVLRVPDASFAPAAGMTTTVRVPALATARTQPEAGDEITYDELDEVGVDVTLEHLYHATKISDQALSFSIVDFGQQVLRPQVEAIARGAESALATAMNDVPADDTVTAEDVDEAIVAGRVELSTDDVPLEDRFMAVSPDFAGTLIGRQNLSPFDSPPTPTALVEGTIGRYRGFNVVESSAVEAGTAVLYHRSAFAFANATPALPAGAADSAYWTQDGIGLRHIRQYDTDVLSDASVVSTFAGAALTDANRVYKIALDESGGGS